MEITWRRQSFFEIKTKSFNKESAVLIIDPFEGVGRIKEHVKNGAQIILLNCSSGEDKEPLKRNGFFVISDPGEYEIKGVMIKGIFSWHSSETKGKEKKVNIIYKIEAEGIKICHLGNLGQKNLEENQLEEIGEIDILAVPVDGRDIGPKIAAEIVSQVEPRLVVPMFYKMPGFETDAESMKKFLKIMGAEEAERQKKLKISPRNLPAEETKIVVLEP